MKAVDFSIEQMDGARAALNGAIKTVMHVMRQKGCLEGHVQLQLDIGLTELDVGKWDPEIRYNVSYTVPVREKAGGKESGISQIEWDDRTCSYRILIAGEQMRMDV